MTDAELARALAVDVGDLLRRIRDEGVEDGAALGKRGDREANALILARLAIERPDDAVLSEEANDARSRCAVSRVWVIDPLDGTRDYGERRDDWAVHIGLAVDGRPTLGAVAIRSEEHTSELQLLLRISYSVFCLKQKNNNHLEITLHI